MANERDEIEGYEDPTPRVEAREGQLSLRALVGDARPARGALLRIEPSGEQAPALARVLRQIGNRHVQAQLLSARQEITAGAPIEVVEGAEAAFPAPRDEVLDLRGASFVEATAPGALALEPERPGLMELDPARPALELGIEPLDLLCPLAARGLNLIVDAHPTRRAFLALAQRAHEALGPRSTVVVHGGARQTDGHLEALQATHRVWSPHGEAGALLGLRAAASWVAQLRKEERGGELLVVAELPELVARPQAGPPSGQEARLGEVVDWLGEALGSTREGPVTTLLRLPLGSGHALGELVETLALGDVDAQLLIDADGALAPRRSRSRAELPEARQERARRVQSQITRALRVRDQVSIFGKDELKPEQLEALEVLEPYERVALLGP